jgi:hypothetical protein
MAQNEKEFAQVSKRNMSRMRSDREIQKKVEINGLRTDRELGTLNWIEICRVIILLSVFALTFRSNQLGGNH